MKTMTCRELGGPCDHKIRGNTPEEMMENGMKHLKIEHPDMSKKMESMTKEENEKWRADFMKKWDSTEEIGMDSDEDFVME